MNNRSLRVLKDIYKPYRYTISGRAHILESTSGNVVVKEKEKDLRSLYQYLESRGFSSYPALLDDSREGVNVLLLIILHHFFVLNMFLIPKCL